MHIRTRALLALGLSSAGSRGVSQPRPARAPAPGCIASHHPLLAQSPDDAAVLGAMDPAAPLRLVPGDDGAVLFFRTREGGLHVARIDQALRSVISTRELSLPAGAYSVARGRSGLGVAYVENLHELVFARLSPTGEARNVPRVLHRSASELVALGLGRTDGGFVLAWTLPGQARIQALVTDRLGVPEGEPYGLSEGTSPEFSWLDEARTPVLMALREGDPMATALDRRGRATHSYRWPAGAVGPVEWSGGLYALQSGPVFTRIPAAGPSPMSPEGGSELSVPVAFARGARGVAVLLRDGRPEHSAVTVTTPDAMVPTSVALRYAIPTTLSMRDDGVAVLLAREPGPHAASRLSLITITCPEVQRAR